MDLNSSVVHLSHGLHLQVIPVAVVTSFPVDVLLKILRHKLGEVVCILQLEREGEGEKNREGGGELACQILEQKFQNSLLQENPSTMFNRVSTTFPLY